MSCELCLLQCPALVRPIYDLADPLLGHVRLCLDIASTASISPAAAAVRRRRSRVQYIVKAAIIILYIPPNLVISHNLGIPSWLKIEPRTCTLLTQSRDYAAHVCKLP